MSRSRDLLVLINHEGWSEKAIEKELAHINEILFQAERLHNLAACTEVMDMVRYRRITKPVGVKRYLKNKSEAPFIFFLNSN